MKKIVSLLVLMATVLLLVSCGDEEYKPVASTEEEAQTVYTIKIEDESYEVKYELYRAFFLNLKKSVDNGDESVWTGDDKDKYINKIDTLVLAQITDIYSVLHEAKKIGIDPYSSEFDKTVKQHVKMGVEGGEYNGYVFEGFGGSYSKYLDSLKAENMNYSVQDLLIRYSLAYDELNYYYAGYVKNEQTGEIAGVHLEYTEADVYDFYYSDDCVRVLRAWLPLSTAKDPEALRLDMLDAARYGDEMVRQCVGGKSQTLTANVDNGEVFGRLSLDKVYYGELLDAAFTLEYYDVSKVITLNTDMESGYSILYKLSKSSQHLNDCYDDIAEVYKQNEIGKMLEACAAEMKSAAAASEFLSRLDRASIKMQ